MVLTLHKLSLNFGVNLLQLSVEQSALYALFSFCFAFSSSKKIVGSRFIKCFKSYFSISIFHILVCLVLTYTNLPQMKIVPVFVFQKSVFSFTIYKTILRTCYY